MPLPAGHAVPGRLKLAFPYVYAYARSEVADIVTVCTGIIL